MRFLILAMLALVAALWFSGLSASIPIAGVYIGPHASAQEVTDISKNLVKAEPFTAIGSSMEHMGRQIKPWVDSGIDHLKAAVEWVKQH